MATLYKFDFSRLTAWHLIALGSNEFPIRLMAIHSLTVGGVYLVPVDGFADLFAQFNAAFAEFANQYTLKVSAEKVNTADDTLLRDMLDGIEGL